MIEEYDILVIGSVIGGMTAAYYASLNGLNVCLLSKGDLIKDSNTYYAQGGIIYKGENDNPDLLIQDILKAGDYVSNIKTAKILANEGPQYINDLLIKRSKINFTKDKAGKLDLAEEAAHSKRRIIHSNDYTGKAISEGLSNLIKTEKNITILENHLAIDLIFSPKHIRRYFSFLYFPEVLGAYVLDIYKRKIKIILSKVTILATGGIGRIYAYTTNPLSATGDGIAMARRVHAHIVNMEYTQFHPTALYQSQPKMFLISEAVRGEGAQLKTINGIYFMKKYHSNGSLAPRDVVARAIYTEMIKHHYPYVLLDLHSYIPVSKIKKKFPTIYKTCKEYNIDITKQAIPVVPAFHYICGGVKVDEWGRTNVRRLFAVGEVSCTGIHGANRLASTSLLEGLVWGGRCINFILDNLKSFKFNKNIRVKNYPIDVAKSKKVELTSLRQDWITLQNVMWNSVGLIRRSKLLYKALTNLEHLYNNILNFYKDNLLEPETIQLINGVQTGIIVTEHAISNKKSKGTHYRID